MSAVLPIIEFAASESCHSLADLAKGLSARIESVQASRADIPDDLLRRLRDLGFVAGEHIHVLARGPFGGEPLAVRVGTSTFALRRLEAECIRISPCHEGRGE